jgi:hypothetical protein
MQVNKPLARPSGACLDPARQQLWVANSLSNAVTLYALRGPAN